MLAVTLLLGACAQETSLDVVIDVPADDPDADAFANLDGLIVTVANTGSDRDLVSQTFDRGEQLSLPGVPFGESLVVHMSGFVGASTVAYGRSCPFAVGNGAAPATPHVFFSRSVKFATLPLDPLQRFDGTAVALGERALILGGKQSSDGTDLTDVEEFDPTTGTLVPREPVSAREGAAVALIGTSPQRVVVMGGTFMGASARFFELIDPVRPKERVDDSSLGREGMTATSLSDGRVIAIGGNERGSGPVDTIIELVDQGTNVEVRQLRAHLVFARTGHTATRLGDDIGAPVLIAGGSNGINGLGAPIATAELFKPLREEVPPDFVPNMVVPRSHHQAVRMPDGSVLIIGGVGGDGMTVAQLELFTLDGGFTGVGDLPEGAGRVDFTATTLPDGRVLIAGGRRDVGGPALDTAYIARLNPLDGTVDVVATDHLAFPRANHQAALLCDGTVLITGGEDRVPAERYNPPATGRR